ncbi:MAG: LysR family transcriptional regulator [Gammaproteobacteria bacterium]|nr:LysR family transcriptional regulator [Gammaproteobacteria bacterium]MDH3432416.1 LysR family transcriptional regulator [Gammaproteobacteria bacterium]
MNFRHLEVFYAVMINGTVTAASRQLGVTQPSVTTTLKQAEASLGIRLFQREGGRLIPTDEARVLFDEAERAHEALAAVTIMARSMKLGLGGHVRVAAVPTLSMELLPDAIAAFEARHTGFQYSVATDNTEEIVDELDSRSGTYDLGFTLGMPADAALASTQIGTAKIFAVAPADWELNDAAEIELAEFEDRPYIAGFDNTALGLESGRLFAEAGLEPNTIARSHAHVVAGALVLRGIGYALLDSLTVHNMLQGPHADRIAVRQVAAASALPVVAVYPSRRQLGSAAAIFIECFQEAFDQLEGTARASGNQASEIIEA